MLVSRRNSRRKTRAEYEAAAAELIAEITRFEEQMDLDHAEAERLKVETQVIKARSARTLSQLREQIAQLAKRE